MTKKKSKLQHLTNWDWEVLVAAWRYYEHRHTISSVMFPHDIVMRYWNYDKYDEDTRNRIATQFVDVDHYNGPDEKYGGWVGDDSFGECDRKSWRMFYWFLYAQAYNAWKTLNIKNEYCDADVVCFCADGKWYSKDGYIKHGHYIGSYYESEIKTVK